MINWFNVIANALWVLGCALALTTLSYASWQASLNNATIRTILGQPKYLASFALAGTLFCIGLTATSDSLLEIILWAVLSALFVVQLFIQIYQVRTQNTH
jgi:hypothetical protein